MNERDPSAQPPSVAALRDSDEEEAAPPHGPMPLKIGVMGEAGSNIPSEHLEKATELGQAIADADCVVVTGACPGLPLAAALGAKRNGGTVIGISPALSLDEHAYKYESPTLAHDVLNGR
jgi:predicted Rossmann-fold nucleotide-binding protein